MATYCLGLAVVLAFLPGIYPGGTADADDEIPLHETATPGRLYHVEANVGLSGRLAVPDDKDPTAAPRALTLSGLSTVKYDERLLEAGPDGLVRRTVRIYRQFDFKRKTGDREQVFHLRPEVRRVVWQRLAKGKVPFSPDGPFTWGELDAVRTDLMTTTLLGLLPDHSVRVGVTWQARPETVVELTDLDPVQEGGLECKLQAVEEQAGRRFARVSFRGKVRGLSEDGPNRHEIDGYLLFDLGTNHLSYLTLTGTSLLLDKDGSESGRHKGVFVLSRQVDATAAELGDAALAGRALEANADNTLLLYDDAELGVRMNYPRRWREAKVEGLNVIFQAPGGAGAKLTLAPPNRVPAAAQLQADVQAYLRQANARVLQAQPPKSLQVPPRGVEHFALEVETPGAVPGRPAARLALDYYLIRQAVAGATVAAQVPAEDTTGLRKELERMMLSLTLSRPVVERPP